MGSDSTFAKGDRVDRFEIQDLIAQGGMGAVYRAVDTKLQRTVALKVVRADRLDSTGGDQARQRFLREALAISKVDHRNVVRVLDFGFAGETPYLAMEYLRGRDLGRLLKASNGFLPIADVVDVMLSVCAAIRACHRAGIIHRDLKPSNVFLCEGDSDREVKILDFGVSKPPIASDLTREGQIVGTPQYLAPEQVDGKAVPETDQYAIAVMLYSCLTKSLPYQNLASFGLLRAIVLGKFPPPRVLRPDLPEKLEAIVLRAMRIVPAERFESVYALGRELWDFATPDAREQWRGYYLDERLAAPPKASTHGMPLIEAMARGLAAGSRSGAGPGFAATVLAEHAVGSKPVTPDQATEPPPSVEGSFAPSSTVSTKGGRAPKRRRPVVLVAIGALAVVLAGGGWAALRPASRVDAVNTTAAPVAPAAPTRPTPTAPPAEEVPRQERASVPTPAQEPHPFAATALRPPLRAHAEKRHPRNNRTPTADKPSDGVPIMP